MIKSVAITKRAIDIFLSLSVLIICFFPILFICILIMLESSGCPIYFQRRMKMIVKNKINDNSILKNNTFFLIKLRTMKENAEESSGPVNAAENDLRVTKIGQFLRRTRIDEIPNFLNVLMGDMSTVGPRADRYEIQEQMRKEFPLIFDRLNGIKPGITGLAQLNLLSNGETAKDSPLLDFLSVMDYNKPVNSFRYKLYYDSAYAILMNNYWTFLKTDLMIMIKTPFIMFFRKNVI